MAFLTGSCNSFSWFGDPEDEDLTVEEQEQVPELNSPTPHPLTTSAWHTQALLLSQKLPTSEEIQSCKNNMDEISKTADNEPNMIKALDLIAPLIQGNPTLWHWCFYIFSHKMDTELDRQNQSYKEKTSDFLNRMKQLWIQAHALDNHFSGSLYFQYLQARYIEISQTVFGRSLSITGRPMEVQVPPKAAGPAEKIDENKPSEKTSKQSPELSPPPANAE